MQTEIAKLQALALEHYAVDGGEMYECYDESDYADLIAECKTADAAWALHLRITEARREAGGYYEKF
jgi:hypothetical protein